MVYQYDIGAQQDFDNMTLELGKNNVEVQPRTFILDYSGQEGTSSGSGSSVLETVFLQELDSTHEMIASGQLDVGDVRLVFQKNTTAEEEGYVIKNSNIYKIIQLTKVRGMANDVILYTKAFGKKVPNR